MNGDKFEFDDKPNIIDTHCTRKMILSEDGQSAVSLRYITKYI